MNINNSYLNILKYVSINGKKSVLENAAQPLIRCGTKLSYSVPVYKSVPVGLPQKAAGTTYKAWEGLVLNEGKTRSDALKGWFDIIKPKQIRLTKSEQEIINCYKKENFDKIEFFKTLSPQEKDYIINSGIKIRNGEEQRIIDQDERQFFAVLSGYKPAWYCSHGYNRSVDFSKIKLNPKVADKFDVVKLPVRELYFLNKEEVLKIIDQNKDVYCAGLGLKQSENQETIYKTLLNHLERWNVNHGSSKGEALFGITLGYPRHSCMIFELEHFLENRTLDLRKNVPVFKDKLLELLHGENSPYKGYPKETLERLEKHIAKMDKMGAGTENLYQCTTYGNEEKSLERLLAIEKDFNEIFRMEDLM